MALCKSFGAAMTDRNAFRPKFVASVPSTHDWLHDRPRDFFKGQGRNE